VQRGAEREPSVQPESRAVMDRRSRYSHAVELRELVEAIVASPDDDAPRRVYADALLESGEPQGELIHIQCDLARGGMARGDAVARRRRERELLAAHGARWTDGLRGLAQYPIFRRGFVDEVVTDPERFPDIGSRLFAAAPALRGVMLIGLTGKDERERDEDASARILGQWQRTITCAAFERVRGLGFQGLGYQCRVFGEVTPGWESLTPEALACLLTTDTSHLDALSCGYADHRGIEALIASPSTRALERLAIWTPDIQPTARLLQSLTGSRLRSLSLAGTRLGVLDHPVLAMLSELRIQSGDVKLAFPPDQLERFAFATDAIKSDHVDAILASVRDVRELCLDGRTVPGYRRLARADLLHLRELRVCGTDIGYAQAVEILEMPCAAQLEVLYLMKLDDAERAKLERRFGIFVDVRDVSQRNVYWR
jgi:uncharacterized protein (TIGR02996 family)